MKTKLSFFNTISKILFLLLTPAFFRVFNFGFIWHSIYWGTITFVVLIWMILIAITPLFGRIGCGWFCFVGTVQDLTFGHSLFKLKTRKPIVWLRFILPIGFFASSLTFFFIHLQNGTIEGIQFIPNYFGTELSSHYLHIWVYDTLGALLIGIFLEKRWACKNLCVMGSLSAVGAKYSRLLPLIDTNKCTLCRICETVCPVDIPIIDYVVSDNGLVTSAECLLCGKCTDICNKNAIPIKFVWNRKNHKQSKV